MPLFRLLIRVLTSVTLARFTIGKLLELVPVSIRLTTEAIPESLALAYTEREHVGAFVIMRLSAGRAVPGLDYIASVLRVSSHLMQCAEDLHR